MTRLVAVVDHGMGNLRSVSQALLHAAAGSDCRVVVTSRPDEVLAAERVVLPGQGAMRDCMRELATLGPAGRRAGCRPQPAVAGRVRRHADAARTQRRARHAGPGPGARPGGEIPARRAAPKRRQPLQAAADGLEPGARSATAHPLWRGVPDDSWFYFLHSYYAQPSDECHSAAHADYGGSFTCAVARDNIFATQFHPEKSATHGLNLYRNFLAWMP